MEKAIIQTLVYAEIFDYPLKAWEIHKWLIKKKASLSEVEKGLTKLIKHKKIVEKNGLYVLRGKERLIKKRLEKATFSRRYLKDAQMIGRILKLICWIELVGISGTLAMDNAGAEDDIDLFIITKKDRLWLTRLSILLVLSLLERRRKRDVRGAAAAGTFCVNLLLEEDQLEQERKNLYISHEVLQMKVLWDRHGMYQRFLLANEWVFQYLPNWVSSTPFDTTSKNSSTSLFDGVLSVAEWVVRFLQLRYMGRVQDAERVGQAAVFFHPEDNQPRVLTEFHKRVKKLGW